MRLDHDLVFDWDYWGAQWNHHCVRCGAKPDRQGRWDRACGADIAGKSIRVNKVFGVALIAAYASTVVLANWFISNVGITFGPGPHLIEVWPTIYAPSGVLWVAAALTLRNLTQERLGKRWAAVGIVIGATLSWFVASPQLALASTTAFAASESLDMLVWTVLRRKGVIVAQGISNLCSDVVDSVVFLTIAFGSLGLLAGQIIGKEEVTAATVLVLWALQVGRYERAAQRA